MKRIQTWLIHLLCWTGYFLTIILGTPQQDLNFWVNFVSSNLPMVILFYINTEFIFPRFMKKGKYIQLAAALIFFIIVCVLFRFIIAMIMLNATISDVLDAQNGPRIWSQVRFSLLFTGIGFAVWYARRNFEMAKNHQQLEKEIADAQLMSLKNQINPHFLYNTLSFLYTKSLPLSQELSDAIARLSEMMRYSLNEVEEDGKVALEKEVKHLQNFIQIHQMRYDNRLNVNFHADGSIASHKIVPLLLITFVENAFKHGKVNDKTHPVTIQLHANEKSIRFRVNNQKSNGVKERSSGIGLQNIRNRLSLAYPGRHELTINDSHEFYSVDLILEN